MGVARKKILTPLPVLKPDSHHLGPHNKTAAKTAPKPKPEGEPATLVDRMTLLSEAIQEAAGLEDVAALVMVQEDEAFPQEALTLYSAIDKAHTTLTAALKMLDERLKARRTASGGFEDGPLKVQYNASSKVSPKWKEEAVEVAGLLANAKGVPFVEDLYVDRVKKKYPASESISVSVVNAGLTEA